MTSPVNWPQPLRAVRVGDQTLEYHDIGGGPCVVLFHGGQCSSDDWAGVAARLASRYRVIVPDGLVHPLDGWSVWLLLDHLGIERAALVAHSAGSRPVREMALLRPAAVWAIVSIDGNVTGPGVLARKLPYERFSPQAKALYERHRADMLRLRPHHQLDYPSRVTIDCRLRAYEREAMTPAQRAATRAMPAQQPQVTLPRPQAPAVDEQAAIEAPVLLLVTGRDKIGAEDLDPAWLNQQRGRAIRVAVMKPFGHWPWLEDEAAFLEVVLPFLETHRR